MSLAAAEMTMIMLAVDRQRSENLRVILSSVHLNQLERRSVEDWNQLERLYDENLNQRVSLSV